MAGARGFETVGVDRSPHQLAHAARKAPGAELLEADILELELGRTFDIVTSMFDSLNYLLLQRDLDRTFRIAARHLRQGGVFAFDMKTVEGFRSERSRIVKDTRQVTFFDSNFDARTDRHTLSIVGFVAEGSGYRRFDEQHTQRGYDADLVVERLGLAGLSGVATDFETGRPAGPATRRAFYVCSHKSGRSPRRRRAIGREPAPPSVG